jgi:CPA1 family monovalent cation:H+ antiporter
MVDGEIPHALELLVGLLCLAAFVAIVARPLRLPYTVGLVVAGLLVGIGASAAGYPTIDVSPELVLIVLLPGLVFEAGYRLHIVELRRWFGGLALLAIPGVLISAAVVAVILNVATGLRLDLAFIVGAMVSATDPAAVVATFKRVTVPPALSTMVDGESLLNDGTGLVLFAIAVQAVYAPISPTEAVVTFAGTVALSVLIGLVTGSFAARVIGRVGDHLIELTITVVLAYGSYLLADHFHLSGVIATVTAAIVLGNVGPARSNAEPGTDPIDTVWEFIAYLLTAVVFLLVGLAIPPALLLDSIGPIAWAIVAILIGRALVVYLLLGGASRLTHRPGIAERVPTGWLHVLLWAGLRGAVAVAMALSLPADLPQRELLQEITFGVVLFTLLVQGTTVGWVVDRAIGERASSAAADPNASGDPAVAEHADVGDPTAEPA